MRKKLRLFITIAAVCLISAGCGKGKTTPVVEEVTTTRPVETEPPKETETETESEESLEGKMRSRLTGEWVDEKIGNRRPAAIMLNNIIDAVPQSGIEKASVVYEAPVEGGLTRLMGIFEDYDGLDKIGSVRSCRLYYVYFAKEFDAIYVHFGQAIYAESLLNSSNVQNLNGLQLDGSCFYRTDDRPRPHNAYISAEGITKGIAQYNYRTDYEEDFDRHYQFNEGKEEIQLTQGVPAVKVTPGYAINKPWFEYNKEDGLYYRYQYGDKQIDQETGKQLAYKNIIMQTVDYYDYGDGYLNITTTGSGTGKYITNGKAIDITWKKDSEFGITRYYDASGKEITLNQGKTWVCIIQDDRESKIVLE